MRRMRLWVRTVGLVALVLLMALPPSASAATTVRTFTASHYSAVHLLPAAAPPVTIGAHALLHLRLAPGYAAAGTQGVSPGVQGTTVILAACAVACTDRYRPASSAAIPAGAYVERITFTVTQPRNTGPAVGFDVDVAVHLTTGWVSGRGYFSTGVATGAATSTITLDLFVYLAAARPTVSAVEVTLDRCATTTGCP